jgi:uncharacterized repeat protein (TIGR01451 family)
MRERADVLIGEQADFLIVVTNEGTQPLTNLNVVNELDPSLTPTYTSEKKEDYRLEGQTLVFPLASLSSGEKREYVIRCECEKEAPRACLRAKVTAAGADPVQQEACVQIRAATAPAGLSMTVSTLHEPVAVGKELTYVIQVTNGGKTEESQVVLTVRVPDEMIPALLGMHGPQQANVQGKTVEFRPVPRIAPGETLTYRVRVQAKTAGNVRLKAELTSRNQRQAVLAEVKTTIVPGQ